MNISFQRRTDLAISALRALNGVGAVRGVELAEEIETTPSYLPQVMAPLVKAGWVTSERGPGGGYRLADVGRISLFAVVEATEGSGDGRCVLRDAPCPGERGCPVHAVWSQARDVLVSGFQEISAFGDKGASP